MQRQDRKCSWAAILITEISVADNRLGISSTLTRNNIYRSQTCEGHDHIHMVERKIHPTHHIKN